MKRRDLAKRVPGDGVHLSVHHQTDRSGWLRKFCGRGIFRELWRNRYVSLRGEHLLLSDKEVKDDRRFQEVFSLCEYERSEELRKTNRRSKKNHSRFTLLKEPGSVVPNLVFLAVSPEEKELWVNALNSAIVRAKNHVLDEVTLEENSVLVHPTRDRVRIPQSRRLPTRGHLLAVASSSCSMLTLDLVAEEEDGTGRESPWENRFRVDLEEVQGRGGGVWGGYYGDVGVVGRRRAGTDVSKLRVAAGREVRVKTSSLPRGSERSWGPKHPAGSPHMHRTQHMHQGQGQPRTPQPGKRASVQGRSRCSSMDGVLSCRPVLRAAQRRGPTEEQAGGQQSDGQPAGQLHNLIAQKMQRAQELLEEMRLQELQKAERGRGGEHPYPRGVDSPRLHHLRASDSSHSRSPGSPRSRSSDSPRLRGKDSPRQRGRESPRSRAKKNRSKGNESQKSTESPRVPKATASPRSTCAKSAAAPPGDPERPMDSCLIPPDRLDDGDSPKVSMKSSESSCQKAASSPCGSSDSESPPLPQRSFPASQSRRNFPSLSKSFDLPHPGSPAASPVSKTSLKDLLRQRSFDSSSPRSTLPSSSSSFSSSRPCQLSEEEESEVERRRAEAEHLLEEAVMSWREAQEVLQEVRDLQSRTLRRQRRQTYDKTMPSPPTTTPPPSAETDIGLPMATAGGADGEEEEEEEEMEEEDPSILLTSPEDDQSEMA